MRAIKRLTDYLKAEVWRPDEPRIHVRKQRPGLGWTINLHAVRERLRARRRKPANR
jgi:hypothetical protein